MKEEANVCQGRILSGPVCPQRLNQITFLIVFVPLDIWLYLSFPNEELITFVMSN